MLAGRVLAFLLSAATLLVLGTPSRAFAQARGGTSARPVPLHVVELDSDDAEDQSEALTAALRARVRDSTSHTLLEAGQTLSMLIVALKCPPKPDAACLQRIGDQVRSDRFLWGFVSKAPGNQVTADLHLWTRGKGDIAVKETYSDNLKDPSDESLRKIAARLFDKLLGNPPLGFLVVTAPNGVVFVDGERAGELENGRLRIEVPAGARKVEVRAEGGARGKADVTVLQGFEETVSITVAEPPPDPLVSVLTPKKGFPVRRIVGYTAIGVGAVFGGLAAYQASNFFSARSELDDFRSRVPNTVRDVCDAQNQGIPDAVLACRSYKDANNARTLGLVFGGVGVAAVATGVILLVTDSKHEEAPAATQGGRSKTQAPRIAVTPVIGPSGAGFGAVGVF